MKHFLTYILIFAAIIGCFSCSNSTSTLVTSNVAKLATFTLTGHDSLPGLAEATFLIDEGLDTGLVHNIDSMRYGTSLKRVCPRFTCEKTPGAVSMQLGDTTVTIAGSDTLDFTRTPIYITITSSDLSRKKTYKIETTVHSVDPDLYKWTTLNENMYPVEDEEQQVVLLGETFYLYCNNGFSNRLYSSTDATTWKQESLTGLPEVCRVKGIISDGKRLYYAASQTLYTSTDALNWTANDYSGQPFELQTILMTFNDTVWIVLQDTTKTLYLGQVASDTIRQTTHKLSADFPVSGFATVTFESISGRRRAAVIGGYTRDGRCVNSRWNIEYAPTIKGLYNIINYSIEQPEFETLTGVSVIWYKKQLMMFGGVDEHMVMRGNEVYCSKDEGYTWQPADTLKCRLPKTYTPRQKQSVIVKDNNIYVFGGQNQQQTFSDAYRGRLNSIDWDD